MVVALGCMIGAAACGYVACQANVNDSAFCLHAHAVANFEPNVELAPSLTFYYDLRETTAPQ